MVKGYSNSSSGNVQVNANRDLTKKKMKEGVNVNDTATLPLAEGY